jgi:type IX secretion system PorP/SprF family membrane protein
MKKSIFILFLISSYIANSQDFIFSQYFASQPYLNPALTGFFDGSYRINAHFRNQWAPVAGGINTFGVNGDVKFGDNDPEKDYFALGMCAYRDQQFSRVSNNLARINASFTKRLGYGELAHFLSIGANAGMELRQVNTDFTFVNPGTPETPQFANVFAPNAGLGLNYQVIFPSFANVFVGGSVDHLVSDRTSIFNSNETTAKRIIVYSSARLRVTDKLFLLPTVLHANQATSSQTNLGVSAQMLMRNYYTDKTNIQVGISSRLSNSTYDAIIGTIRYENKGLMLGLSYDHNLNELSQSTGGYGALEFTVGYIGLVTRAIKSRAECPDMKSF